MPVECLVDTQPAQTARRGAPPADAPGCALRDSTLESVRSCSQPPGSRPTQERLGVRGTHHTAPPPPSGLPGAAYLMRIHISSLAIYFAIPETSTAPAKPRRISGLLVSVSNPPTP